MSEKHARMIPDQSGTVVVYLVVQILDVLTTFIGLRLGASEANLVPRWLFDTFGELWMYAFKAVLVVGVLFAVVRLQQHYPGVWSAIRVVNVMMVLVVAINLLAIV